MSYIGQEFFTHTRIGWEMYENPHFIFYRRGGADVMAKGASTDGPHILYTAEYGEEEIHLPWQLIIGLSSGEASCFLDREMLYSVPAGDGRRFVVHKDQNDGGPHTLEIHAADGETVETREFRLSWDLVTALHQLHHQAEFRVTFLDSE